MSRRSANPPPPPATGTLFGSAITFRPGVPALHPQPISTHPHGSSFTVTVTQKRVSDDSGQWFVQSHNSEYAKKHSIMVMVQYITDASVRQLYTRLLAKKIEEALEKDKIPIEETVHKLGHVCSSPESSWNAAAIVLKDDNVSLMSTSEILEVFFGDYDTNTPIVRLGDHSYTLSVTNGDPTSLQLQLTKNT